MPFPLSQAFATGNITATGVLIAQAEYGGNIVSGNALYFATLPTSAAVYYPVGSIAVNPSPAFSSGTGFTTGTYGALVTTGGLGYGILVLATASGGHVTSFTFMATGHNQYYTQIDIIYVTCTACTNPLILSGGFTVTTNNFTINSYGSSATTGVGQSGTYLMSNITSSAQNPALTNGVWMFGGLTQPVSPTTVSPVLNAAQYPNAPIEPNTSVANIGAPAPFGGAQLTIPPLPFPFSGAGGGTVGTPI